MGREKKNEWEGFNLLIVRMNITTIHSSWQKQNTKWKTKHVREEGSQNSPTKGVSRSA